MNHADRVWEKINRSPSASAPAGALLIGAMRSWLVRRDRPPPAVRLPLLSMTRSWGGPKRISPVESVCSGSVSGSGVGVSP
ncbi:hypothetical protein ACFQX7_16330 [Luedemannella flava]